MNAAALIATAEPVAPEIADALMAEAMGEPAFASLDEALAALEAAKPEVARLAALHAAAENAYFAVPKSERAGPLQEAEHRADEGWVAARTAREDLANEMVAMPVSTAADALRKQEAHAPVFDSTPTNYQFKEDLEHAHNALLADVRRLAERERADDGLVELWNQHEAFEAPIEEAGKCSNETWKAWFSALPALPQTLMVSPMDALDYFGLGVPALGGRFTKTHLQKIRDKMPEYEAAARRHPESRSARLQRAVTVLEGYEADERARQADDVQALEAAHTAASAEEGRLYEAQDVFRQRIRAARPTTLRGFLIKASLAHPRTPKSDDDPDVLWPETIFGEVLADLRAAVLQQDHA